MRLAYFSPLTPQRSGISDYSEELLPHLAGGAEITLFVDGFQPVNRELNTRFEVRDYRRQSSQLRDLDRFDAIVYHLGNDHRYHTGIFQTLQKHPGIVVFHDFALQEFFLGLARERGDLRLYLEEVGACHGSGAQAEAAEALSRGALPGILARPIEFPLNRRIANSSTGIIVHSEWSRSRLASTAPSIPLAHIPMPVRFSIPADRTTDADDTLRIASFGLITPGKGIEQSLRALSALKQTHRFRYALVGETNPYFDVRELIRRYRMQDHVEITGHVTLDEFKRRIAETDIALNIRERTVGETSASLVRLLAAGVCSVVAEAGWYAELPADCVAKIPLDPYADQLLVAYLDRLMRDQSLRGRIGDNARRFALTEHSLERGAANYLDFIGKVIGNRPRREFVANVSQEALALGVNSSDETFLKGLAAEIAILAPGKLSFLAEPSVAQTRTVTTNGNRAHPGRTPKAEGIDYKRAAIEYLGKLGAERQHHLRTKPFYNLANKPAKYKGDGMDEDMHRHFCDFANMAVTLALPVGSRILDVGCGSGWMSEYFARLGYELTGIDISPDLIEMSRERVARLPYGVDHETPVKCKFQVHDIEEAPLADRFDAIVCYDSLHHFEDEQAVMRHLAAMLPLGGVLFIVEGDRPSAGSESEAELRAVMKEFRTLESPFDFSYLRQLLEENGLAITGDYISVNGLFEREVIANDQLPLKTVAQNYHYLVCKKVADGAHSSTVPDSRQPGRLLARITASEIPRVPISAGETIALNLEIRNTGDTLWLASSDPRAGVVMPAIRISDASGALVREIHGQPALPRAVAPGETVRLKIEFTAPQRPGKYVLKFDLVSQHVCWFEDMGSTPLLIHFEVRQE